MFESLTQRLSSAFDSLRGRGAIKEQDVLNVLREVRISLLEADVALPVVKHMISELKVKAVGQDVLKSITPDQMIIKIIYDYLVEFLGTDPAPLNLKGSPPVHYLMVGLQGSGKTTTTGKLARHLRDQHHKNVLMVSLDTYRPAAQRQLAILGETLGIETLPIIEGEDPLTIAKRALDTSKKSMYDVVLFDTAGRLHIDDHLMKEVQHLKSLINPLETLLIADAMTGQDAVTMAKSFHDAVPITGVVLTRIDGDSRGGAALSVRYVTQQPIKFLGVGEKLEALEVFDPHRIADRILDRGDVVSLVEKAAKAIDHADAEKMAKKMSKGQFDLNDLSKYLSQMLNMGGMGGLLSMMPGMGKIKEKLNEAMEKQAASGKTQDGDAIIRRQIAIISSMTPKERTTPTLLNGPRKKRIAKGAGVEVFEVNRLLKQFEQMATMMKRMKKMGMGKGMMRAMMSRGGGGLFGG